MKKYLIPALALGLVITSCQSDEPFAPVEGGEKQVTFTLTAPTSMTRAGEQKSSNLGGLSNKAADEELHYTLALYYGDNVEYKQSITSTDASVTFNPTVILGRNYRVVAYADFVDGKADLTSIAITNGINNEKKDAYFANPGNVVFTENDLAEQVTLTRPFGKLRLVATDYSDKTKISNVSVKYRNGGHLNSFNAFSGEFAETKDAIATYNAEYNVTYQEATGEKTIFVDYIPVNGDGVFPFEITVTYENGTESFTRTFAEDIPVKRNALTTLKGKFFTADANISVAVDDNFDGGKAENRTLVSSASQLQEVINTATSGETTEIILGNDIELTEPLVFGAPPVSPAPAQTRSEATKSFVLDLNGKSITGTMPKDDGAVIKVAEGASLKVIGGTIKNTTPNGDAAINNAGNLVLNDITIEGAPIADGGYPNYAVYTSGKLVVEEGTTITSDRGALHMSNGADVTINGGNISVTDALGTRALTAHVIYASGSTSKLTINDGNFALNYNAAGGLGASVICPAGATIKVFDGDFIYKGVQGNQSGIFQNYMGYGAPVNVYGGVYNDATVNKNLAAGYKAIKNGDKYYVVPNEIEAVATTTEELAEVLANSNISTIMLGKGTFEIELYTKYPARESMTIIGTEGTKVKFANQQVRMPLFRNFTIKNCEILHMSTKSWGMLVFSTGDKADGVYTVENCLFNGVGTQGIYINEDTAGATYNVKNCTFKGDFGSEGAVVIQNNVNFTVNVTGCTFNNVTDNKIYVKYKNQDFTLNTDVPASEIGYGE